MSRAAAFCTRCKGSSADFGSRGDESQDEAHGDIFTDATSNLTQTSQMIKTGGCCSCDVRFHCQFRVEQHAENASSGRWLNCLGACLKRAVMNGQFCQLCA
jgi:hypothetical protein